MIIDVPDWVGHGHSDGISAIDIDPKGRRLVTCGSEPQIKIWNLLPILDPAAEQDPNVPKLLAMLSEHRDAGVQIARFNHSGNILASGGSDNIVLLYKLSPAPATATLGSVWVNKENWRAVSSLRGPSLDITGLSWSKNDQQLATSSMDGSIHIYSITPDGQGSVVHTIRHQHHGWVKGVAFDPVGRYLASQGRNGVKVWNLEENWALTHHMKQPFEKAPESVFRLSISWAPDGDLLAAPNGSNNGKPTICVFRRQDWSAYNLVGHRSSVGAAIANPRLFHPSKAMVAARKRLADQLEAEAEGREPDATAAAADDVKSAEFEQGAMTVLACGSTDKTYTVWGADCPLPLLQVSQVHSGAVTDFCWTPDGYTLIAASGDDTISVVRFTEKEIGKALTDAEFEAHMQQEYGNAAAGNAAEAAAIQDPELAQLAAASTTQAVAPSQPAAAAALAPPLPGPIAPAPRRMTVQPTAAASVQPANGMLERRLMPTGAGITTGTLQQQQQAVIKKRAQPTMIGSKPDGPTVKRPAAAAAVQQQLQALPARCPSVTSSWPLSCPPVVRVLQTEIMSSPLVVVLTATNSVNGLHVADVAVCTTQTSQPEYIWKDKVQGQVVAVAGSPMFAAAATASGMLHVWRPGGNLLLPPVALGCPAVSLTADGDWGLQIVGADGSFHLLDFLSGTRPMGAAPPANISSILSVSPAGTTLREAWVSGSTVSQGRRQQQQQVPRSHMATLTDGSGWLFHNRLGLWMQLQPGVHEQQAIHLPRIGALAPVSGDILKIKHAAMDAAAAAGFRPPNPSAAPASEFRRKGAEQQLQQSLLLGDPGEYQRWLGLLVTAMCENRELGRLKELSQDLLGPDRWTPDHGDVPWCPRVLGLDKRWLLGEVVVPIMARYKLELSREVRDAVVDARKFVNQHQEQQEQQQQQQQMRFGVNRLGPGLPTEMPYPQQMMQAFTQQQQQQQHQADPRLQRMEQQQGLPEISVPQASVPEGVHNATANGPPTASHLGLQQQQQQQQQPPQQRIDSVGSDSPEGDRSVVAPAAAVAAVSSTPRRLQPQVVASVAQPEQQRQQQQQQESQPVSGRQPLQQVPVGQQQLTSWPQQQGDKIFSRSQGLEEAVDGGQEKQLA